MRNSTFARALLASALFAVPGLVRAAEDVPPPASPAPAATPASERNLIAELDEARRALVEAEHTLRSANAEVARASRRAGTRASELERLAERQQTAQEAFDQARERVPQLVAEARAAGVSASVLRSYEHQLYGD